MKAIKFFSILAVAALLLAPATAMAKTRVSFSLNLFDCLQPLVVPRPIPVPVFVAPAAPVYYFFPVHAQPRCPTRTIVKEYHYYHQAGEDRVEDINPSQPHYQNYPHS